MRVDNSTGKGTSGMDKFSSEVHRVHIELGGKLLYSLRIETQLGGIQELQFFERLQRCENTLNLKHTKKPKCVNLPHSHIAHIRAFTQKKVAEMLVEVPHFHLIIMSALASIGGPFFLRDSTPVWLLHAPLTQSACTSQIMDIRKALFEGGLAGGLKAVLD